jgi:hypothetical protein
MLADTAIPDKAIAADPRRRLAVEFRHDFLAVDGNVTFVPLAWSDGHRPFWSGMNGMWPGWNCCSVQKHAYHVARIRPTTEGDGLESRAMAGGHPPFAFCAR